MNKAFLKEVVNPGTMEMEMETEMEKEVEMNMKMEAKEMVYAIHMHMGAVPASSHLHSHSAAPYQSLTFAGCRIMEYLESDDSEVAGPSRLSLIPRLFIKSYEWPGYEVTLDSATVIRQQHTTFLTVCPCPGKYL